MTTPETRFNVERDIIRPALEAAARSEHSCLTANRAADPICTCHVGRAKLALSFFTKYALLFGPDTEEMNAQLGKNWVIARRTHAVLRRYGKDVVCLSQKQYDEATRRAVVARAHSLGVALSVRKSDGKLTFAAD